MGPAGTFRTAGPAVATVALASGLIGLLGAGPALAQTTDPSPSAPTAAAPPPAAGGPVTVPGCLPAPPAVDPAVPWAQQQLAPERAWPLTRGAGVTVAVVDTGVDGSTPQLGGGKVLPGADVASPGARADADCYGHGTFVAGIVAASPTAGTGFAGVAPAATVLPIRVTGAQASDTLSAAALAAGIRTAVDRGAQVVNVSASTTTPDAGLAAAVSYAASRDVVVVASAANSAQAGDPVTYPASYPSVIAVGAVDATGKHADFSQTGPYLALVAPGVDVVSVGPRGPGQWQGSGTSYAAPFVAGTVALVRAYHPELTAEQVEHRLEATANHPATTLPDAALGWGTVDPAAAVSAVLPEEGGASDLTVGPPAARPVVPAPPQGPSAAVGVLAAVAAVAAGAGVAVVSRLGRAGHRRGWGPARVGDVRPSGRAGPGPGEPARAGSVPGGPSAAG